MHRDSVITCQPFGPALMTRSPFGTEGLSCDLLPQRLPRRLLSEAFKFAMLVGISLERQEGIDIGNGVRLRLEEQRSEEHKPTGGSGMKQGQQARGG